MKHMYVDETGYTGMDYLNTDQPFLVVGALLLEPDQAAEIKRECFSEIQAQELKHSQLKKHSKGQRAMGRFMQDIVPCLEFGAVLSLKRYALVAKYIDMLVEPLAHQDGVDLYQNNQVAALASLVYKVLPADVGCESSEHFWAAFQQLIKQPSLQNFDAVDLLLQGASDAVGDGFLGVVLRMAQGLHERKQDLVLGTHTQMYDITVGSTVLLSWMMSVFVTQPIPLVHDESSNMRSFEDIWEVIQSSAARSAAFEHHGLPVKFPGMIQSTRFASSHEEPALQLVDVLVGAINEGYLWQHRVKIPGTATVNSCFIGQRSMFTT